MNLDPSLVAEIREIMLILHDRIADHEEEIIETLQSVATGELEMVETITPEEERYARLLFGWVAEVGPQNIWDKLAPLVPELLATRAAGARIPLADLLDNAGLGEIPSFPDLNRRAVSRLAVLLMAYVFFDEFHSPQPETGVYDIAGNPFQKLKWAYRHWLNQLEVAEPGSGLEDFFASHRLEFPRHRIPLGNRDEVATVSVSCAGDLLAVDVLTPERTPHLFDGIADFYSTADIVSANLESTVDKDQTFGRFQAAGQPARMNTSEAMFQKFRHEAKINYFATATNHAMDWDESGVLATLDVLNASGAHHSGTAASQAEQDDVLVVEKNGIRVALLSYTFDLNGYRVPADKSYLVNEVRYNDADPAPDYSLVRKHVAAAKAKGADHVIAYCHWGWEFEMYPHVAIVEAAHELIGCGIDTILGNHAHVSQPAQAIPRGDGRQDALVVYSFGNFVSYHPESRNSQLTYAIKFDIRKDDVLGETRTHLANLDALPLYIANVQREDGNWDCRIVKFADVLADPDGYGLTDLAKSQLPHLNDVVWKRILAPLSALER